MTKANNRRFEPLTLSLLRVVTGAIFLVHGFQKLFGALGGIDGSAASAHFMSNLWMAGVIESIGAVLLVAGLFTRPVALILSAEIAYIYYRHHAQGIWPVLTGGAEPAILCCLILLFIFASGAGPWSLDQVLRKSA
jgi:putative oxidoreductase